MHSWKSFSSNTLVQRWNVRPPYLLWPRWRASSWNINCINIYQCDQMCLWQMIAVLLTFYLFWYSVQLYVASAQEKSTQSNTVWQNNWQASALGALSWRGSLTVKPAFVSSYLSSLFVISVWRIFGWVYIWSQCSKTKIVKYLKFMVKLQGEQNDGK